MNSRVLLIEDSDAHRRLFSEVLRADGHEVYEAWSVESARRLLPSVNPQVVVLDLSLDGKNGADLLRELQPGVSAIVVSADVKVETRIDCLEAGALDFMVKPVNPRELTLRVQKLISRQGLERYATSYIDLGPIVIDLVTRSVTSKESGKQCRLTNSEFAVFIGLLKAMGSVLGRSEIATFMAYDGYQSESRSIDVLISKLRKKMKDIEHGSMLKSIRGEGYRLRVDGSSIPVELFEAITSIRAKS